MKLNYDLIADKLDKAFTEQSPTNQISSFRPLNIEESYAVQSILVSKRYIRGHKLVGLKMGFTSRAKMEQMGVHDMIWGRLTSDMEITPAESVSRSKYIHPRAEPEIAFKLNQDIEGIIDLENIKSVVAGVAPAIEIIDSRYENFKFSLEDVIADNCSSVGFCIGKWYPSNTNIQNLSIKLKIDNNTVHEGNSNAILGNPWQSLVDAIRLAHEYGVQLKKDYVILAGAATAAFFIEKGHKVSMEAEGMDEVYFEVKE